MKQAILILDEMIEELNPEWFIPSNTDSIVTSYLREAKERIKKETWWISVEDRLPEEFIEVLTYWPNWMCVDDYENPNNRTYRNWFHRMSDTTHWMPLPLHTNE